MPVVCDYDTMNKMSIIMKSKNEEYYLKEIASIFEELYKIANYGNILSDKINSDNANSNLSSNLLRSYIDQ